MINTYKFDYTYKGKTRTRTIVTYSLEEAMNIGELYLEGLNEELDLLGADSWEDVRDECKKYDIIVSDIEEEFD